MTLFQLSYLLLWVLAICLVIACAVLLYLAANLRVQVARETAMGIKGHWLIGRSLADLSCRDIATGSPRRLGDSLAKHNVVMGLSPTCGSCEVMLNELLSQPHDQLATFNFVVLCMGELHRCESMINEVSEKCGGIALLAYDKMEDQEVFWVGWPAAILVNEEGAVIDVRHPPSIQALLRKLRHSDYEVVSTQALTAAQSDEQMALSWNTSKQAGPRYGIRS